MLNLKWYWYIVIGIIIGMIISYMLKKPATTVNVQGGASIPPAGGIGSIPAEGIGPIMAAQ